MVIRVSAILNSYVHRQYLDDALRSVVSQESLRPLDIVVLSPDPAFSIPRPLEQVAHDRGHEVRILTIPAGPAGVGLKVGASAARGDLLAVIDDDDLWEPGKIRWIERSAEAVPRVGYLHNAQRFVDSKNRPLSALSPHRLVRHPASLLAEGRSSMVDPRDAASIARGMAFAPDFNNSSCVIDRAVLLDASPALDLVARGEDSFLFYTALLSGRPMALTSDRLTRYRLHPAASTAAEDRTGARRLAAYVAYATDHVEMIELIQRHLADRGPPEVREWLAHEFAFWTILRGVALRDLRAHRGQDQVRAILGEGRVRPRSREVYAGLWGIWGLLTPALARSAFLAWRRAW